MIRQFLRLIFLLLFGRSEQPYIKNLRDSSADTLSFDGLTRGTLISGNPGTGKTTWTAMEVYRYAVTFVDRAIIVFDPSKSIKNEFLEIHHSAAKEDFDKVDWRIVNDQVGDDEYVVPRPLFSDEYGLTGEEQVQRVTNIMEELNAELIERNPTLGFAIKEILPELARLIYVTRPDNERWQLTEARRLLIDTNQLAIACKKYGEFAGGAKFYFENDFLHEQTPHRERDLRSYALRSALGVIEPNSLRARHGYNKAGYTEKEVIEKGLIVFIDTSALANQPKAQAWVMWDAFASLKAVINKRIPHDPRDKPVLVVFDETYQLYDIKGLGKELGRLYSYYRSRKLMPVFIIQAFWQLDETLAQQIWGLGNFVTFAMEDFNDAYQIAQQLFKYDPTLEKFGAPREGSNPTAETDRGQYLAEANWVQNLENRQLVMRRYETEKKKETHVRVVRRTRDKPPVRLPRPLVEIERELLKRRAVPVREALKEINNRKLVAERKPSKRPTVG